MPLAIETHKSQEGITILCKGHVLLGNEIEHLLAMLHGICIEDQSIVLDLSAVENLDICNLAPLLIFAERKHASGCKVGFAQFQGRVRQQLLCSQAVGKFSAISDNACRGSVLSNPNV